MGTRLARIVLASIALAGLWAAAAEAAFPGHNGKLAFYARVAIENPPDPYRTSRDQVFTINPDGTGLEQLTNRTDADSQYPAWSADGRTIAFDAHDDFRGPRLWLMDGDGSSQRALPTFGFPGGWAPDGETIVVTLDQELWLAHTDGSPLTRVTGASSLEYAPTFSPDGTQIAFASNFNAPGSQADIYTVKSDLTEDWVRLVNAFGTDAEPDYSPDGSKIVFESNRSGSYDLWAMNADGTNQTPLTTGPADDFSPVWSPDGTRIAFSRRVSFAEGLDLYVMNADGTGTTRITNTVGTERLTDWQAIPNRPPDCAGIGATPASLWPPNGGFRTVALGGATDPDGDPLTLAIDGVTQDEPVGPAPDARPGAQDDVVRLRAERRPAGDGRVCRISFTVSDGTGSCSGFATVEVRRHRQRPAVDSAPPSYDSFDQ